MPITPPVKLLLAWPPVARVKLARSTVPAPTSEPMVWFAANTKLPAAATVTADAAVKRLAAASVSLPPLTATVLAAALPASVLLPVEVNTPTPRLAVAPVLPPVKL